MSIVGSARTNNSVEAWHNVMSVEAWHNLMGCKHPCIYRFLKNIIKEQGYQEMRIAKIEAGEEPEKPKRSYRDYEKRFFFKSIII